MCFSSRRRHTRCSRDWSSDVCSSDLHGWPVFCCSVWHADGDLTRSAIETCDLDLMIATDAEVCEFRWYDRFGVYGEQEFSRADSRLECNAIFYHVHEHPTLAVNCLDRTQGGVDRIGRRNTVAPLMKESCVAAAQCLEEFAHAGLKRFSFDLHETRG